MANDKKPVKRLRLTKLERRLIQEMAFIADNQPWNEETNTGEGDYGNWTSADFDAVKKLIEKL